LMRLRVIAHQHLAEGRMKSFDMFGKVLAVLEVEFVLTALLSGASNGVAVLLCLTKDGGAELLVDQDASLLLWYTGLDRGAEAVVNHLLSGGDFRRLRGSQ